MHPYITGILLILINTCTTISSVQQSDPANNISTTTTSDSSWFYIPSLEWPYTWNNEEIISHTGFSLLFNETHKQANWVAYTLTLAKPIKSAERTNRFRPDPKINTGTATNNDYTRSGYDRGHLAPAADMRWSSDAMNESFYFSNISPQKPSFNRGVWKRLEELVRKWAIEDSVLYVVSGPVLKEGLPAIGDNKVSVPEHFYKVFLVYKPNKTQGIGFILPNEGSSLALTHYAVSIDSVEHVTGLNFFHLLDDDIEEEIESTLCIPCWDWPDQR